jgi:hypothetical protein
MVYLRAMSRDLERPRWKGQRPWLEMWFASVLDADRRRALWVRQTLFVPPSGDGRATIWGAWFDAGKGGAAPTTWSAKRFVPIDRAQLLPDGQNSPDAPLITIDDAWLSSTGAAGQVGQLGWDVRWTGGRTVPEDVASWLPAPTHAAPIVHDADATGEVTFAGAPIALSGRAIAIHVWGRKRMPTLHWIYAPWLGDGSFEVQAISLSDTFSLGLASLRLDDADKPSVSGRPATAAHPGGLITATVAGARRMIHARAWAEPAAMVGYAYRDTDNRDLMIAHSDIGSASLEVYQRTAPGAPWRPVDERRTAGGVALEIHQHAPLPEVRYLGWDHTEHAPSEAAATVAPTRADHVAWPEVTAIVALGLTYGDHGRETGQKVDPKRPPTSFTKHVRAFAPGAAR